ncbi:MAG: hypothetical protein M3N09_00135 [Actinomycetota bacterium]|nr:hypothetical protein [Actinomycetota bacterium]
MIRTYARLAGVVLLALAVVGFSSLGWRVTASFYHAGVGLLFLYVGFWLRDPTIVRQMVGGLGVLLVLVKAITTATPLTWGGAAKHGPIEITCLVLGITSILAARYLKDGRSS